MDIIKAFENNNMQMHITIKGTREEPLFRASDIGAILDIATIRTSIKDFDNTEKAVHVMNTIGGDQKVLFLTEQGLYKLLFRSEKPIAKTFTKWVCNAIKEIRLTGKYEMNLQLADANNKIVKAIKDKETNFLNNYNKQTLIYLILVEMIDENGEIYWILKFGWTDDIVTRLTAHKNTYGQDIEIKHIFASHHAREIERRIKSHPIISTKIFSKKYNDKNKVELIKITDDFTIENLKDIILSIKTEVESLEVDKNKDIENDRLKLRILELELELKNKNEIMIEKNQKITNTIFQKQREKESDTHEEEEEETIIERVVKIDSKYKYFLKFLEDYYLQHGPTRKLIKISNDTLYKNYLDFLKANDQLDYMARVHFGRSIMKCPNITAIRITIEKDQCDYKSGEDNRIKGNQIIIDDNFKNWISNEYLPKVIKKIVPISTPIQTPAPAVDYTLKNLAIFLNNIVKNTSENAVVIHNHVLYDNYKKYSKKNDLTFSQFGLYIMKVPGVSLIKGADRIWAKKLNCGLVIKWTNLILDKEA